jgi:hypothetical protein
MPDFFSDIFPRVNVNEDKISVHWLLIVLSKLKDQSSQGNLCLLLLETANSFACYLLQTGFLFGFIFNPEDRGDTFPRNLD